MNVLITGGAGFIGSHLAERCLREGWNVVVIDDLSTGSLNNIAKLRGLANFECRIGTIFDSKLVHELVDRCDLVVHLAAAVGVRLIVESPVRTIETNVYGTEVVLSAAAQKRKRVLLASTSEVYGKNAQFPCFEDADLVLGPSTIGRWSYACSKLLDEFLGIAYWREKQVPINVVRLFNTIGPRQTGRYGMVVPTFVRQAMWAEPLTVHGTGDQTRCFAYVDDVVEALVRLASSDVTGEVINVGNDEEISIIALARLVKEMTGSNSDIRFVSYRDAYGVDFEDTARRVPSVAKIERLIGFRPRTPVREALAAVIADMQRELGQTSLPLPTL